MDDERIRDIFNTTLIGTVVGAGTGVSTSIIGGRPFLRVPISAFLGGLTGLALTFDSERFQGLNLNLLATLVVAPTVSLIGNFLIIPLPTVF